MAQAVIHLLISLLQLLRKKFCFKQNPYASRPYTAHWDTTTRVRELLRAHADALRAQRNYAWPRRRASCACTDECTSAWALRAHLPWHCALVTVCACLVAASRASAWGARAPLGTGRLDTTTWRQILTPILDFTLLDLLKYVPCQDSTNLLFSFFFCNFLFNRSSKEKLLFRVSRRPR